MKIVFITYEFKYRTFSGNGVLAQSTIRGLAKKLSDDEIFVICARPDDDDDDDDDDGMYAEEENVRIMSVRVPKQKWGKLDRSCAYEEFANGLLDLAKLLEFNADVYMGVDWSSANAFKRIVEQNYPSSSSSPLPPLPPPPFVYLNYRVFTLHDDTHRKLEEEISQVADLVICLCKTDAKFISEQFKKSPIVVIHPPLREDVKTLADQQPKQNSTCGRRRNLLTCVVRLSEEKEPERFIELVEHLAKIDAFNEDLVPILVAPSKTEYAEALKKRFREATKTISTQEEEQLVIEEFLDAKQLADLYSRTKINVHPCRKDAYGMTVIEAAAYAAPSLICSGGEVGAGELLGKGVFSIDYENETIEAIAIFIMTVCLPCNKKSWYDEVARLGKERALAYDETEYANLLTVALTNVLEDRERGS